MLNEGDKAPDFELPTESGDKFKLSGFKGKGVVLYFYPKDDTSGLHAGGQGLLQVRRPISARLGSRSSACRPTASQSHQKFSKKYDLAVRLAADEDKAVATAYGVWVEKSMYGRKYMGVERSTFLIDKSGRIAKSWRKVKVPGHAEEVLAAARALAK